MIEINKREFTRHVGRYLKAGAYRVGELELYIRKAPSNLERIADMNTRSARKSPKY